MKDIIQTLIIAFIGRWLWEEFAAWHPRLCTWLLWFAVRQAPEELRERLAEEWQSHLAETPGFIKKAYAALGFSFAAFRMKPIADAMPTESSSHKASDYLTRGADIVLSSIGIVILSPMLISVGFAVYINNPGPIIFRQIRIGKGGRKFGVFKFRTMDMNRIAEKGSPKIFAVGALLRQSSIDELPQLFNVLLGDMSLVGPRPITEAEALQYGRAISSYQAVRPGVTGLSQVRRSWATSHRRRVALNRLFRQKRSLRFYFMLLMLTVPAVFMSEPRRRRRRK